MSWLRIQRVKKKCYQRKQTIIKNRTTRQKLDEIQTMNFGEHPARACLADCSYRLSYLTIGGDRYVGIIKCMDKENTRTRCFMPLASWHSIFNEALPKMTYPPISTQTRSG